MSRNARAYLCLCYALGAASLIAMAACFSHMDWTRLTVYVAASLALSIKTVRGAAKSSTGSASVSLASAATFGAILGIHPLAGVFVASVNTAVTSVFPKRRPLYQAMFNVSCVSVGALVAGLVYHGLAGPQVVTGVSHPADTIALAAAPMLLASIAYFFINSTAVAEIMALVSGVSLSEVWRRNFQSSFIGYTAGAACAVLVVSLSARIPVIYVAVLCVPILYACHSREQSDEARLEALEKGKERLHGMYVASIRTLALTVAAKDRYTSGHIHRVTAYALAIAKHMGCTEEELTDLETGALLHDVGKIGVPEHILTKPGRLNDEEMTAMRRHAEIGWAILEPLEFPDIVKQIVRHHHEWFNGAGYPDKIGADDLPLLVRIVCVSDVFDALTSNRPYRAALSLDESRDIMRRNSGSQFDPVILNAFFEVLDTVGFEALQPVESDSPVLTEILDKLPQTEVPLPTPAPLPSSVSNGMSNGARPVAA